MKRFMWAEIDDFEKLHPDIKIVYNHRTPYIVSLPVYSKKLRHYIGLFEYHDNVKNPYIVAWKFKGHKYFPNTYQEGKTKDFDTFDQAYVFIIGDYE